jgi:hypothetical protein
MAFEGLYPAPHRAIGKPVDFTRIGEEGDFLKLCAFWDAEPPGEVTQILARQNARDFQYFLKHPKRSLLVRRAVDSDEFGLFFQGYKPFPETPKRRLRLVIIPDCGPRAYILVPAQQVSAWTAKSDVEVFERLPSEFCEAVVDARHNNEPLFVERHFLDNTFFACKQVTEEIQRVFSRWPANKRKQILDNLHFYASLGAYPDEFEPI